MPKIQKIQYESRVLWSVLGFGEEISPAGKAYWFENEPRTKTDVVVIQYTIEGEAIFRDASGEHPVPEGHVMIFRHGENSAYEKKSDEQPYSYKWINLGGAGLAEHYDILRARHGSVFNLGKDHPTLKGIDRLCGFITPDEPANPLLMAAAVHRLTMAFFTQAEAGFCGKLSPANLATHYITSSPYHPWNLKELASQCGCSREHLSREFTAQYGKSPQQFLMECRGERALYLLQHTALPIVEVATQAGFPNTAALTRQMQHMTGKPPNEHRPVYTK